MTVGQQLSALEVPSLLCLQTWGGGLWDVILRYSPVGTEFATSLTVVSCRPPPPRQAGKEGRWKEAPGSVRNAAGGARLALPRPFLSPPSRHLTVRSLVTPEYILGTVHKAKGLEFDTVHVLDDFVKVPCARHNLAQLPHFRVGERRPRAVRSAGGNSTPATSGCLL